MVFGGFHRQLCTTTGGGIDELMGRLGSNFR
jgi:hypothetical protein